METITVRRVFNTVGKTLVLHCFFIRAFVWNHTKGKKKVAHTRLPIVWFRIWSRFLAVSLQVVWVINPAVGCQYFLPGLELPPQPWKYWNTEKRPPSRIKVRPTALSSLLSLTVILVFILTYGPDFQFLVSYSYDPLTCRNQGQRSVGSKDRVETNGRTTFFSFLACTTSSA